MTMVTVAEVARIANIKRRSARSRLYTLVKAGKATPTSIKKGRNGTGQYELYIPLKELIRTASEVQLELNGNVNYKQFCADPFNLGRGAR